METAGLAGEDGASIAASLSDWIGRLTFTDLEADAVTSLLVASVIEWATARGWRTYRRAPSVFPLPAPYEHKPSCVDIGCARPVGDPVVVEVDHFHRQRTIDKLLAESSAGRVALWVRWSEGDVTPAPPPLHTVGCRVRARRGSAGRVRTFSRGPERNLPAPEHTTAPGDCEQDQLFW